MAKEFFFNPDFTFHMVKYNKLAYYRLKISYEWQQRRKIVPKGKI